MWDVNYSKYNYSKASDKEQKYKRGWCLKEVSDKVKLIRCKVYLLL